MPVRGNSWSAALGSGRAAEARLGSGMGGNDSGTCARRGRPLRYRRGSDNKCYRTLSPASGEHAEIEHMARGIITLGEVAGRTDMIELRCGRCDRRGRLNTVRLLREHGPGAAMGEIMRAQVGDCPKRNATQIQDRCDPYCLDLARLFAKPRPKSDC